MSLGGTEGLELGFGLEDSRVAGSGSGWGGSLTLERPSQKIKDYIKYANGGPNDDPNIGLRSAPAG